MIRSSLKTEKELHPYNGYQYGLFFLLFFFYIFFRVNPALHYQRQEPVFLYTSSFLSEFLDYPGGIVDYVSALFAQFFLYSWLGAIIITLIAWLITIATQYVLKRIGEPPGYPLIHFFPSLCLLALHSQYEHPLGLSIGLLFALLNVFVYIRFAQKLGLMRIPFFIMLGIICYYVAAGPFLLFGLLCGFYELFSAKQTLQNRLFITLVYVLVVISVPFLSQKFLFTIRVKNAYFYPFPFQLSYNPSVTPYLLFFFFPLAVLFQRFFLLFLPKKTEHRSPLPTLQGTLIQNLVLLLIFGITAYFSFNKIDHIRLQGDYFARRHMWENVLHLAKKTSVNIRLNAWNVNRALFHTGRLADSMFVYFQGWGYNGLFLPDDNTIMTPLHRSDQFFELGHINEAQHWAYEAFSIRGRTPWILQRLAQIHLIKGQYEAAHKYLKVLAQTGHLNDWTHPYLDRLNKGEPVVLDRQLQHLQSVMPRSDFIAYQSDIPKDLEFLLQQNSHNKMAFEYLMAAYLLNGDINKFMNHLLLVKNFNYPVLPQHYEEAILIYLSEGGQRPTNLQGIKIRRKTVQRFEAFRKTYLKYQKNKNRAQIEMTEKFADTYWYYLLYTKPVFK